MNKQTPGTPDVRLIFGGIVLIAIFFIAVRSYVSIPAGHVGVATLFGKVQDEPYAEGLHVPVNPFYNWHLFDVRQKTHKETASVPSQDQLQTRIDVSAQYRLMGNSAPRILRETGQAQDMIRVHLVPKLRSVLREQGKTIERAEDFFREETQEMLQMALEEGLRSYLEPRGMDIQAVLIRNIMLPQFITKAIEAKKEREQAVERQKAELARFKTEQEQKIAQAQAERKAAEEEAAKVRVLAEARAFEIEKINKAISNNSAYVKLEALRALQSIAKDPAAKLYFLDGDSPNPLPLMHIGEQGK